MPEKVCSVEGCPLPVAIKGRCKAHDTRARRGQDMTPPVLARRKSGSSGACEAHVCDAPATTKGYCNTHYMRLRRRGDANIVLTKARGQRNGNWAGTDIGYGAAHVRVKALWGPARAHPCIACGKRATAWAYDGADPSEKYEIRSTSPCAFSVHPEFYMPMCRGCHNAKDRANAAGELAEYRAWKIRTGLTLSDLKGEELIDA